MYINCKRKSTSNDCIKPCISWVPHLRFVDDSHNIQSSNGSGIFSCLTLGIIEVSWYSNDGIVDLLSQEFLCDFSHFTQNHGRDLLWCKAFLSLSSVNDQVRFVRLVRDFERVVFDVALHTLVIPGTPDQSLDVEQRVLWIWG